MRRLVEEVHASEAVLRYVVSVTSATREHGDVFLGASPRASRMLLAASRARAATSGRSYCTPDDVKAMALRVLSHRIIPSSGVRGFEAARLGEAIRYAHRRGAETRAVNEKEPYRRRTPRREAGIRRGDAEETKTSGAQPPEDERR